MDDTLHAARELALAVRDAIAPEVDDVEVVASCHDSARYTVENDHIVPVLQYGTWSVAMRALKSGRIATAATTSPDARDSVDALRRALGAAQPDPLPRFAETPPVERDLRNADESIWSLVDRPGEVRRLAAALREGTVTARPGFVPAVEAEVSVGRSRRALVTGRGGPAVSASTSLSAYVMVDGNDWDAWAGTARPDDEKVTGLGRALVSSLPARAVTCEEFFGGAREVTAVIDPRLLESLLRSLFLERVALDRVLAGVSSAKEGDRVAHESFHLADDTGAAGSLAGGVTDDEGTPGARKVIVAEGVLRALPSDRRSAHLAGAAPTGNGFRIPILAEDRSEAPVRVGFGHLEAGAGDVPRASLVKGRTVLVTDLLGLHSSNKATGAFNNPIQGGLALEDGVPVARVKPGAWSATGNLHAMLRSLAGVSRERLHTGSALLPWVAAPLRVA